MAFIKQPHASDRPENTRASLSSWMNTENTYHWYHAIQGAQPHGGEGNPGNENSKNPGEIRGLLKWWNTERRAGAILVFSLQGSNLVGVGSWMARAVSVGLGRC